MKVRRRSETLKEVYKTVEEPETTGEFKFNTTHSKTDITPGMNKIAYDLINCYRMKL